MPFALKTIEPTRFGSGWISGVLSAALGLIGLSAVLCFLFPDILTTPEARGLYPVPYVRGLLHLVLVAAFVLGAISLSLRRNKALGTVGVAATLIAALLGGSRVELEGELDGGPVSRPRLVSPEPVRLFAAVYPARTLVRAVAGARRVRRGWRTYLAYFFVSSLFVQVLTILTLKPIYVLGFAETALVAYLVVVSVQARFIHANVNFAFGPLKWLVATPQFHHWHHAAEAEAVDKNFAVHLPLIDVVFGTWHLPDRWPRAYGIAHGEPAPEGYLRQFAWPFRQGAPRS